MKLIEIGKQLDAAKIARRITVDLQKIFPWTHFEERTDEFNPRYLSNLGWRRFVFSSKPIGQALSTDQPIDRDHPERVIINIHEPGMGTNSLQIHVRLRKKGGIWGDIWSTKKEKYKELRTLLSRHGIRDGTSDGDYTSLHFDGDVQGLNETVDLVEKTFRELTIELDKHFGPLKPRSVGTTELKWLVSPDNLVHISRGHSKIYVEMVAKDFRSAPDSHEFDVIDHLDTVMNLYKGAEGVSVKRIREPTSSIRYRWVFEVK